jgi:hypothetical protein
MSNIHQVAQAEMIFRELLRWPRGGSPAPSHQDFLAAVRRFAAVEFDIADAPNSDGFLFEYGTYRSLPDPGFGVGIARQFEIVDESGDHDHFIQVWGEYLYPIESDLEELGKIVLWWFRDGPVPFDDWFSAVLANPVWDALAHRPPLRFYIEQETV